MNKLKFITMAAGISFAMAFTFIGCSGDDSSSSSDDADNSSSSSAPNNSSSSSSEPESSSSSDSDIVQIGEQFWMKKNFNVAPTGDNVATNSWCYGEDDDNCDKYGRLYDWATAMALEAKCNTTLSTDDADCAIDPDGKHQGICPDGFHIPTNADWDKLIEYVDEQEEGEGSGTPYDSETAGEYLKAASGWNSNGNGTDKYGFSALPGGNRSSNGDFINVGNYGYWWSASESYSNYAYGRNMDYDFESAYWGDYNKAGGFSVRCVQD